MFLYVSGIKINMKKAEHVYEAFVKRRNIFEDVQNYVQCDDNTFLRNELMKWLKAMVSVNEIFDIIQRGITIRFKERVVFIKAETKRNEYYITQWHFIENQDEVTHDY